MDSRPRIDFCFHHGEHGEHGKKTTGSCVNRYVVAGVAGRLPCTRVVRECSATLVRRPLACINKCSFWRSQNDQPNASREEIGMHRQVVEPGSLTHTTQYDSL